MTPSALRQILVSAVSSSLAAGLVAFSTAGSLGLSLGYATAGALGGATLGWVTRRRLKHPVSTPLPPRIALDNLAAPSSSMTSNLSDASMAELKRASHVEPRRSTLHEVKRSLSGELRKPDFAKRPLTGELRSVSPESSETPSAAPPVVPEPPSNFLLALYSLLPSLRQGSLTLEELLKLDRAPSPQEHERIFNALKPLFNHTHITLTRAQHSLESALAVSFDKNFYPHILEPVVLRDELVHPLQTVCLSERCELAFHTQNCSSGLLMANRRTLRVCAQAVALYMLRKKPNSVELLCELTSEERPDGRLRISILFDSCPEALGQPAPPTLTPELAKQPSHNWIPTLAHLYLPEHEMTIGANDTLTRVSLHFTIERAPLQPQPAPSSVTPSFVGRQALVVDSRSLSRRALCELMQSWQLASTSVSTLQEALNLLAQGRRHDMLIINLSEEEWPQLQLLETQAQRLATMPILTLEDLRSRLKPLPSLRLQDELTLDRLIRPLSPVELLERLQARLHPPSLQVSLNQAHEGLRVLVVEDNPVNQTLMSALLERMGYLATVASHGAEALDILLAYPNAFSLILMDIQMPFMDGYETTTRLRLRETNLNLRRIPVIAVTAHAMEGEQNRCLEAGMDSYLAKPIDELTLRRELRRFISPNAPSDGDGRALGENTTYIHFDAAHVRTLAADDLGFIQQLITVMRDTSARLIRELHQALEQGSLEQVSRIAHQLKGGVSNFRATHAQHAAAELETRARRGPGPDIAPLVTELERSLSHLLAELRAFAVDEVQAHRLGLRAQMTKA